MLQVTPKATNDLADVFKNLGQNSQLKTLGNYKMKVIYPNQKVDTSMEEGEIEKLSPQGATAPAPKKVSNVKLTFHDDADSGMSAKVIYSLHLDLRGKSNLLKKEDMYKYTGNKKFNPKSFKSGSSVGYIDLDTVPYEVKSAQI